AEGSLGWTLARQFRVRPSSRELSLVLGLKSDDVKIQLTGLPGAALVSSSANSSSLPGPVWVVRVPPHTEVLEFAASFSSGPAPMAIGSRADSAGPPPRRWPQE